MKKKTPRLPQELELAGRFVEVIGAVDVLGVRRLGLLCSQRCPGDVIMKLYDFARFVRGSGTVIVSGFHSPIEKDCLPILLRGSDPIIMCQAHRLSTTRLPAEWQKGIEAGRLLLLSPFSAKQKRVTAELAAERNRFVAAISDEVLIPYAAPGGKTETLASEVLAAGKPVYTFHSSANAQLVTRGALPVSPEFLASHCNVCAQSAAVAAATRSLR